MFWFVFARIEWCFVFYFRLNSLATSHRPRSLGVRISAPGYLSRFIKFLAYPTHAPLDQSDGHRRRGKCHMPRLDLHGAQTAFACHIHRGEMRFSLRPSDGGAVSLPGNKKHHLRGHRGDDDPSVRASSWRSNARRPLPTCSAAPWHQCRTSLSRPFTSMPDVKRSTPWAAQETFH